MRARAAALRLMKEVVRTADIRSKIRDIYSLEQLSGGKSAVHRRHPLVKLVSATVYIVLVVSFNRAEFGRLIPFVFYPVILMAVSGTPWSAVLSRVALALPFCLLAGISNIVFDRAAALTVAGITVSEGVISFFSIIFRTFLCVTAVLILIAVTPFSQLTGQLRRMRFPDVFVNLLEMVYRYIGVLLEEASSMHTAYMLRSTAHKGLKMRHMGSFVGQLLIRSFDRAERVYEAMKCRGYPGQKATASRIRLRGSDYVFLAATTVPFIICRAVDIPALYSRLF